MALVTTKAAAISNRDATPPIRNSSYQEGGRIKEFVGQVQVATGDNCLSKYIIGSLPSNARVSSLALFNDALGTGVSAANIGLQRTTKDGGGTVNEVLFASALALTTANTTPKDITYSNGTVSKIEMRLWELLGLSADPTIQYDVFFKMTQTPNGPGTIGLVCRWTE